MECCLTGKELLFSAGFIGFVKFVTERKIANTINNFGTFCLTINAHAQVYLLIFCAQAFAFTPSVRLRFNKTVVNSRIFFGRTLEGEG